MIKRLIAIVATACAWCACAAISSSRLDLERTAAIYHSYEFHESDGAPAPKGFKPFYIAHYGRHGSRMLTGEYLSRALSTFEKADGNNALTVTGRDLLHMLRRVSDLHSGMVGQLSARGAEEQRTLAKRMAKRFPDVFRGRRKVRCQATTYPRALVSQMNFVVSLKESAPYLELGFATGDKVERLLLHPRRDFEGVLPQIKDMVKEKLGEGTSLPMFLGRYFKNLNDIGNPDELAMQLIRCFSICQCLRDELDGMDMYRFASYDEISALSHCFEANVYAMMGNSNEFGDRVVWSAVSLAKDFVERADEAISDRNIAADLRFGHDAGLWPLAGLMDLEGPGDRAPVTESWRFCPAWKWMPMAANIQLVFYRNSDDDEVLVKILFNEREMRVRGLSLRGWPYYRWQELRDHILKSADEAAKVCP